MVNAVKILSVCIGIALILGAVFFFVVMISLHGLAGIGSGYTPSGPAPGTLAFAVGLNGPPFWLGVYLCTIWGGGKRTFKHLCGGAIAVALAPSVYSVVPGLGANAGGYGSMIFTLTGLSAAVCGAIVWALPGGPPSLHPKTASEAA